MFIRGMKKKVLFHRENRWTDKMRIIQNFPLLFHLTGARLLLCIHGGRLDSAQKPINSNLRLSLIISGTSKRLNPLPSDLGKCCNAVKYSNLANIFVS